jgi:hypothetical protein
MFVFAIGGGDRFHPIEHECNASRGNIVISSYSSQSIVQRPVALILVQWLSDVSC